MRTFKLKTDGYIPEEHESYAAISSPYREKKQLDLLIGVLNGVIVDGVLHDGERLAFREHIKKLKRVFSASALAAFAKRVESELLIDGADMGVAQTLLKELMVVQEAWERKFLENKTEHPFSGSANTSEDPLTLIRHLTGLCHGIIIDGDIYDQEAVELFQWLKKHKKQLQGHFPFDGIFDILKSSLRDGVLDELERRAIVRALGVLIPADGQTSSDTGTSTSICSEVEEINLNGAKYVLTGTSEKFSRNEFKSFLEAKGAIVLRAMRKDTDYVVYCGKVSGSWSHGAYGRKIEKALQYIQEGSTLKIIHEDALLEFIASQEVTLPSETFSTQVVD